jgi:hypothetical protein
MVDKKSPVKRLSVAKSTRAPRSKKLNLDKLITSIKNISTRYKKNGKMTGGASDPIVDKALAEIISFFMDKNPTTLLGARGGGDTALTKVLKEISKIRDNDGEKKKLSDNIKSILVAAEENSSDATVDSSVKSTLPDSLTYIINDLNESDFKNFMSDTNNGFKSRLEYFKAPLSTTLSILFSRKFIPPVFNVNFEPTKTPEMKKALAYISIFQIAHTLATIHYVLTKIK